MKNKLNLSIGVIIALSLFLTSCGKPTASKEQPSDMPTLEAASYNVRTAVVIKQELSSYLDLSGDVEASVSVDVYPDTAGILSSINVELGSYVRKNQVIALIDLAKPGMNYAANPVKAPISGTITALNVDQGTTVSPQVPLVKIGQLDSLIVTTQVPERFIYMINPDQRALITTTALPGKRFNAQVSSISPVVNPVSRTLGIKLIFSGDSAVKAGMFVGIRLITSTEKNALVIPEKALIRRDSENFVFRVNGDIAEKVVVTLGLESEGSIEILEGLSEGDRVITEGVSLLSNGSKIRVLDELSLIKNSMENNS